MKQNELLLVLVPLIPLIGAIILGLGRNSFSKRVTSILASTTIFVSFILSTVLFKDMMKMDEIAVDLFPFIKLESWQYFGFMVDHLNSIFLLVITGVGFLIHWYSTSYMHDESSSNFARYFSYLNLFIFAMLILVMGKNYIITFIGWEGVGLCSYLLIGYWFKNRDFTKAANKAFIMNRIGDLGFLYAMYVIYTHVGTLDYMDVNTALLSHTDKAWMAYAAVGLFIGATGKSAQIPLFTWLPDAMAGPTPVSALIHAATMVTAGIFLLSRTYPIFDASPDIQHIIAWVGLATAFVAATIACFQNDIKKVLAYSTVSQLGFMFIALGMGNYTAAIFHVVTHAFFKALLFLGSGSVIHSMGGEQDIQFMGNLRKKMPITGTTFLIGCLAISGIPIFSGFFSKDEILLGAYLGNKSIWILASFSALLTAFYMFRLYYYTFTGKFRGTENQWSHVHESPAAMTYPLVILAVLATVAGALNVPTLMGGSMELEHFLCTSVSLPSHHEISHQTEWMLMGLSVALAIIGILVARSQLKKLVFEPKNALGNFFYNKWYIDEFYNNLFVKPILAVAKLFDNSVDPGINGIVNGFGNVVVGLSNKMKSLQTGKLGTYLFAMVISIIVILTIVFVINK